MSGTCVILNNPTDRIPCGCPGGSWDSNNTCTQCKHGKRWHGDEWKKQCGRDNPAPAASGSVGGPADIEAACQACLNGELAKVKELFGRLPDKNAKDSEGDTMLHKAVYGDQEDIIRFLITNGVDATLTNAKGMNAVILATEEACMSAARVLNELGCNG